MKKVLVSILVIAALVSFVVLLNNTKFTKVDLSDSYEKTEFAAKTLTINESVNVRSEPKVLEEAGDGSNSFGMARPTEISVTRVFKTNKTLDANGKFYGFLVDDLLSTKEGRKAFPRGIKHDPDGIIWINASYIEVI